MRMMVEATNPEVNGITRRVGAPRDAGPSGSISVAGWPREALANMPPHRQGVEVPKLHDVARASVGPPDAADGRLRGPSSGGSFGTRPELQNLSDYVRRLRHYSVTPSRVGKPLPRQHIGDAKPIVGVRHTIDCPVALLIGIPECVTPAVDISTRRNRTIASASRGIKHRGGDVLPLKLVGDLH